MIYFFIQDEKLTGLVVSWSCVVSWRTEVHGFDPLEQDLFQKELSVKSINQPEKLVREKVGLELPKAWAHFFLGKKRFKISSDAN